MWQELIRQALMINSNDFDSGIEEQKSGKSNQLIGDVSPENRDRERQLTAARGKSLSHFYWS